MFFIRNIILAVSSYLQDNEGHKSSKRLSGFLLLGIAIALGITLFFVSLFAAMPVESFDAAFKVFEVLLYCGVALILGTLIDKIPGLKKAVKK